MLTDKLAVLHCLLAALATAIPSAATNCEGSHSVRLFNQKRLDKHAGNAQHTIHMKSIRPTYNFEIKDAIGQQKEK